jgi:hypothetical protein
LVHIHKIVDEPIQERTADVHLLAEISWGTSVEAKLREVGVKVGIIVDLIREQGMARENTVTDKPLDQYRGRIGWITMGCQEFLTYAVQSAG